jgi:hypothetical protein
MVQSSREKYLFILVFIALAVIGLTYLKNSELGQSLFNMGDRIEAKKTEINTLIGIQQKAFDIKKKFDVIDQQLKLEGDDNQQLTTFEQQIIQILKDEGLAGKYQNVGRRDPKLEDDFKVLPISITKIECTPQQLGRLLYRLEKETKVIEIERCEINNLVTENGKVSYGFNAAGGGNNVPKSGLLDVNLQIARLVEYKKGEAPTRRTRR